MMMKDLFAEADKEVDRILAMTDEEVLAEAKAQGIDIINSNQFWELAIADVEFNKVFPK
jgi:hypothetical protein